MLLQAVYKPLEISSALLEIAVKTIARGGGREDNARFCAARSEFNGFFHIRCVDYVDVIVCDKAGDSPSAVGEQNYVSTAPVLRKSPSSS